MSAAEPPDEGVAPAATPVEREIRQQRSSHLVLLVLAGTLGLQLLTMASGIASARLLGPEGRGVLAYVLAVCTFASQLAFGASMSVSITKNVAARRTSARRAWSSLTPSAWWLILPGLVAAAMVLGLDDRDGASRTRLCLLTGAQTVLLLVGKFILAGIQGEARRLGTMAVVALIPQALFVATLVTALALGWEWRAAHVIVAFLVSSLLGLATWWPCLVRPRQSDPTIPASDFWHEARRSYVSSLKPLDSLGLDRLLIGGLVGSVQLGIYAAALAVANLGGVIGNAVTTIVLPHVARSGSDMAAVRKVVRTWLLFTTVCVGVLASVLLLVVEPLILIAFGQEFEGAVEVARWLIVADALLSVRKVLIAVLQGLGRGGRASWVELLLTPVYVGTVVLGILAVGLVGAGWATVGVALTSCGVLGVLVRRTIRAPA